MATSRFLEHFQQRWSRPKTPDFVLVKLIIAVVHLREISVLVVSATCLRETKCQPPVRLQFADMAPSLIVLVRGRRYGRSRLSD